MVQGRGLTYFTAMASRPSWNQYSQAGPSVGVLAPDSADAYNPPVVAFMPAIPNRRSLYMAWTKPEFTVVAVTLEVTAYAGKR